MLRWKSLDSLIEDRPEEGKANFCLHKVIDIVQRLPASQPPASRTLDQTRLEGSQKKITRKCHSMVLFIFHECLMISASIYYFLYPIPTGFSHFIRLAPTDRCLMEQGLDFWVGRSVLSVLVDYGWLS
jgi:hypothetical protein